MNFLRTRWLFGAALLAAGMLGVATLLWLGRRAEAGRPGLWGAVRGWWAEEIWLGGPFWAGRRAALSQGWFTVTFALFMLRWVWADSLAPFAIPRVLMDLIFWGILAKLLLFTRYSLKQLAAAALLSLPFFLSAAATGSQYLLYQVLFLLCVKDIDLRKAFRAVFWAVLLLVFANMLAAAAGLIPTVAHAGAFRIRNSYGFNHPNTCGKYLLYLSAGWLLLRFDRVRVWDWLGLAALLWFCNTLVDSRSNSLGILALLAAGLASRYLPRFWRARPLPFLGAAAPWLASAASFLIAVWYHAGSPLWDKLDQLSSGRMELFHLATQKLPVTLFGQSFLDEELYTLDSLYLNNLYSLGLIGFLAYFGLLSLALYQCWQKGWRAETAVFLSFLVYGLFERGCWSSTTPAVLLFANAIYRPAPGLEARISQNTPAGGGPGGPAAPGGRA